MSKRFIILLQVMLMLLVVLPTCFAADNETVMALDESNLALNQSDSSILASNDYYFDANADSDGNGSIESPYKSINSSRVASNSILHLADGNYSLTDYLSIENVTFVGNVSEKTIINAYSCNWNVDYLLNLKNITLIDSSIKVYDNLSASNVIFKGSDTSVINAYSSSNVVLNNCTFLNNYAKNGGAINLNNAYLEIVNSAFINNTAENWGGAVSAENSNINIKKSNFINNVALKESAGAIYLKKSNLTAENLNITASSATFGAAITSLNSSVTLDKFYAANNKAKYEGGAVYILYNTLKVTNSQFDNNNARNGGALYIDNVDSFEVKSNKFTNNRATGYAGAVYSIISNGSLQNQKNTFTNNKASSYNDIFESQNLNLNIGSNNYTFIKINCTDEKLPSSYKSPYVTSVKAQGSGGNCWAFTAAATLEASIKKALGVEYDLSEENMKNLMSLYSDYGWDMETNVGGYDDMGFGYLASWLGPVLESDDEYNDKSVLSPVLNSIFHVQNILYIQRDNQTDTTAIKEAVLKYGAVGTCIYWGGSYAKGKNYYYNGESGCNHAVTIVGWDDNYKKTNFKNTPDGNGAWIIKNSWGTGSGDKGYYYVSYYDTRIAQYTKNDATFAFVFNDSIRYDKNYQYDIAGRTDFFLDEGSSVWYKNIFNATGNEYLAGVGTYFEKPSNWTLSVFVNNALKLTQSGSSPAGYFTINLDALVAIKTGDVFVIMFNTSNADNEFSFPISEIISLNHQVYGQGYSYFSTDGKVWKDLVNYTHKYSTHIYNSQVACIKAFTIFNKLKTSITVNVSFNSLNTVDLQAQVIDSNGNVVRSGEVTFTLDKTTVKAKIKDGYARYTHTFKNSGQNSVTASFSGDGYIKSQNSTSFNMTKIISSDITCYYDSINYQVTLQDASSKPLSGKKLTITLDGKKYELNTNSKGQASITTKLGIGKHVVKTTFDGDKYYMNSMAENTINAISSINLENKTEYVYNAPYTATLLDLNGAKLTNAKVDISINGVTYTKTSDANGKVSLPIQLSPDSYGVCIKNLKTLEVKNQTIVSLSSINLENETQYTYNAEYCVTLLDVNGDKLANTDVDILINGVTYTKTSDSNGKVSLTIKLDPDTYVVIVKNPNTSEEKNQTIEVVKRITENKDLKMYYGAGSKYKVKVLDDYGNPAVGVKVTFKVNGKTYYGVSNENGYASIKISLKPKTYTIKATYKGYTVSNKVVVKSTIVTKDITVKKGKTIKFKAKLLNSKGKLLKNKKITFKFKGKTYKVKTNSKGIATLKITKKYSVGKHQISTSYGNLKIKNTIKIKK